MAQSNPGGGGGKKTTTKKPLSKPNQAAADRYKQQAERYVPPKTKLPAPPRRGQGPSQITNFKQQPMLYVPPGTNEIWRGSSYGNVVGRQPWMPPGSVGQEIATLPSVDEAPLGVVDYGGGWDGSGFSEGGGGEEPAPVPITWSEKYQLPGAPEFWKGMMPSQWTPETEFAAMSNALLPYLSPEDQRSLSSNLSRLFPDAFGQYSPETTQFPEPQAPGIMPATSTYFQSSQRASDILSALDKMKEVSGQDESKFGPGYQYLRHLATTMKDFGGAPGAQNMSRRQMVNMFGALDPLLAESKGQQLGAYEGVAKSLTQPFFTAAQLLNVGKDESGNWVFGKANKSWF